MEHRELGLICAHRAIRYAGIVEAECECDYCGAHRDAEFALFEFVCRNPDDGTVLRLHRLCAEHVIALGYQQAVADGIGLAGIFDDTWELSRPSQVTFDVAQGLIDSGEWMSRNQLDNEVSDATDRALKQLLDHEEQARRAIVIYEPRESDLVIMPGGPMIPNRLTVFRAIRDDAMTRWRARTSGTLTRVRSRGSRTIHMCPGFTCGAAR